MCDFCREKPTKVGKDKDGVETYTCAEHADHLVSDVKDLRKRTTTWSAEPPGEPY